MSDVQSRASKPWRVYRFEAPDGRYAELATNELSPEQIQLPPHAAEYRFVRSTEMAPADRAEVAEREREEALAVLAEIAGHFVGPADNRSTYAGAAAACEKIDHLAHKALRDIGGFDA